DAREAAPELVVRGAERRLRLDALPAGDVDEDEQEVAVLLGLLGCRRGAAELRQLFMDLVEDTFDGRPFVADVRGPLLHLLAGGERRQAPPAAVEGALVCRGARIALAAPLVGLDPLPLAVHVARRPDLRVAENMRVATDDLRRDRGVDARQVEDT